MNRKSSSSSNIPMQINRRKSGSLGFRQYMFGSSSQESNEMPSVSRQRASTSFMQNVSMRQSLMPSEIPPSTSRNSRFGYTTNATRKRSSSQEPPQLDKRRTTFLGTPSGDHHLASTGLLLTPMGRTPSKSPAFSLASINSNISKSSRRNSSRMHIIPDGVQKMKDPRVISDKNFKNNAYARIQNFLRTTNVKIKPLSNSVFVQAFNAIYKELDPNMQVTNADYADKISNIIKNLGYPSTISKTSFVAVSSGHAVSQVLAMLSWLVDCVEVMKTINIEDVVFRNCDLNQESHMERALSKTIMTLFSECKLKGEAILNEENVEDLFLFHMGESAEEMSTLEKEIAALKEEIHNLQNDPKKVEDDEKVTQLTLAEERSEHIKNEIHSQMSQATVLKAKINTEKEGIKSIEIDNSRFHDMCAELSDRIERQPLKHTERDKMIEQRQHLNQEYTTKQEHLEMVHRIIGGSDLKITKLQSDVRTVIHDVNAIVLEYQLADQYKWTHNPTHSDANDQLTNAQRIWSQFVEKLELNLDRDEKLCLKIKKDMDEFQNEQLQQREQLQSIVDACSEMDCKIIDVQGSGRMKELELKEKLESTKHKCHELTKSLKSMLCLEELNEKICKVEEERLQAEQYLEERKKFLETYFFPKLHKLHVEYVEKMSEGVNKIFEEVTCAIPKK